jgi:hypothetical protein
MVHTWTFGAFDVAEQMSVADPGIGCAVYLDATSVRSLATVDTAQRHHQSAPHHCRPQIYILTPSSPFMNQTEPEPSTAFTRRYFTPPNCSSASISLYPSFHPSAIAIPPCLFASNTTSPVLVPLQPTHVHARYTNICVLLTPQLQPHK